MGPGTDEGPPVALSDVSGNSRGESFAVGDAGTVVRCSGGICTRPGMGGTTPLYSAWVSGRGNAWVADNTGTMLRCSGTGCATIRSDRASNLLGIWGNDIGVWTGGFDGTMQLCNEAGCSLQCSGDVCAVVKTISAASLRGLSSGPAGTVWAVGRDKVQGNGVAVQCSGSKCTVHAASAAPPLDRVFVGSQGEAWAVSASGSVIRYGP